MTVTFLLVVVPCWITYFSEALPLKQVIPSASFHEFSHDNSPDSQKFEPFPDIEPSQKDKLEQKMGENIEKLMKLENRGKRDVEVLGTAPPLKFTAEIPEYQAIDLSLRNTHNQSGGRGAPSFDPAATILPDDDSFQ